MLVLQTKVNLNSKMFYAENSRYYSVLRSLGVLLNLLIACYILCKATTKSTMRSKVTTLYLIVPSHLNWVQRRLHYRKDVFLLHLHRTILLGDLRVEQLIWRSYRLFEWRQHVNHDTQTLNPYQFCYFLN